MEVRRSWHFMSQHVRSLLLRRRCRSFGAPAAGSMADLGRRARIGAPQPAAVSRPRSAVRDVRPRALRTRPSVSARSNLCECERDKAFVAQARQTDRDRAMAVSQPRPPDRVDAALEKVAPLRYLEAHECARSERAVTRYYHEILSKRGFLSYKRSFPLYIEDYYVFPHKIKRYVILLVYLFLRSPEANRYLYWLDNYLPTRISSPL